MTKPLIYPILDVKKTCQILSNNIFTYSFHPSSPLSFSLRMGVEPAVGSSAFTKFSLWSTISQPRTRNTAFLQRGKHWWWKGHKTNKIRVQITTYSLLFSTQICLQLDSWQVWDWEDISFEAIKYFQSFPIPSFSVIQSSWLSSLTLIHKTSCNDQDLLNGG